MSLNNNTVFSLTNDTFIFTCKCRNLLLKDNIFKLIDPQIFLTWRVSHLETGFSDCRHGLQMLQYDDLLTGIAMSSIESFTLSFPPQGEVWLSPSTFGPLHDKNLSSFSMQGASLRTLKTYEFRNVTHLTRLSIHSTSIETIYPEQFNGMSGLRVLDLHGNYISKLNPNFTTWDLNINFLNLSDNRIFAVSDRMFAGLKSLFKLDLSDNDRLAFHSLSLLSPLSSLRYLDVSRTEFFINGDFNFPNLKYFSYSEKAQYAESFFTPSSFKSSLSLESLIAFNSRVIVDQLWDASEKLSIFQGLDHLRLIDLSSNGLQNVPRGLFPILPKLRDLNLGNCKVTAIEANAFGGLGSLERLYLDHNAILRLPTDIFGTPMGQLCVIHLNSNNLEYLGESFLNTPNLRNLSISENQLTTFNREAFTAVRATLKYMDLSENPIQCTCQIKWLVDWRQTSVHIARENETMCSFVSDVPFRGKPVFHINLEKYCASYINLYFTLPIMAVGLLFVVSVVYYKRWFIKHKIFLLKLAVLGYKEIRDTRDHSEYDFDLNVIFIIADEEWATNSLRSRVKEYLPDFCRIAFGDSSLPPGMYYYDAVHDIIERSFKTLLLLSRAAMRDNDFMMKLRTALNHVTTTRIQCTLLIFLEDIPDEELPHLVKLYLSEERPHICWDHDERA